METEMGYKSRDLEMTHHYSCLILLSKASHMAVLKSLAGQEGCLGERDVHCLYGKNSKVTCKRHEYQKRQQQQQKISQGQKYKYSGKLGRLQSRGYSSLERSAAMATEMSMEMSQGQTRKLQTPQGMLRKLTCRVWKCQRT